MVCSLAVRQVESRHSHSYLAQKPPMRQTNNQANMRVKNNAVRHTTIYFPMLAKCKQSRAHCHAMEQHQQKLPGKINLQLQNMILRRSNEQTQTQTQNTHTKHAPASSNALSSFCDDDAGPIVATNVVRIRFLELETMFIIPTFYFFFF